MAYQQMIFENMWVSFIIITNKTWILLFLCCRVLMVSAMTELLKYNDNRLIDHDSKHMTYLIPTRVGLLFLLNKKVY